MSNLSELLRHEPRARTFLAVEAQSALGTGLGYIALLTLAFDRSRSAWAVAAILAAEFAPAALLGSWMGVLADRVPRRTLMVAADALRAAAFVGLVFASSPTLIITLALLAGVGNAAFTPATLAALPSLVSPRRLTAATGLFGTLDELGFVIGPGVAAAMLLVIGVRDLLWLNALSFVISAILLARLDFGARAAHAGEPRQRGDARWRGDLREGFRAVSGDRALRTQLMASFAFVLFLGAVNVGEVLFVRKTLHSGPAGYALVVTVMGAGIALGALIAGRSPAGANLKHGYLVGLALCAAGLFSVGFSPVLAVAVVIFFVTGIGNGVAVSFERFIFQRLVPDRLRGRVFGVRFSLMSIAGGASYVIAGVLGSLMGPRELLVITGAGAVVTALLARSALRGQEIPPHPEEYGESPQEALDAPLTRALVTTSSSA